MKLDIESDGRSYLQQPAHQGFNVQNEEENRFEHSDEQRSDERLLMDHDLDTDSGAHGKPHRSPETHYGARKTKKTPTPSQWPKIIAIMVMSSIVIVNAVVMSVHFISEALGQHVDYFSFAIVLYLDIIFFGGLLFILAVHAFIFLLGKLMQLVGDSHFFFIYVRLLHNSLSFGIFFWLIIVLSCYDVAVRYIFFHPPEHLQILLIILFHVSLVWVLKIVAKTIIANYLFYDKREDVREWNVKVVEQLIKKLERRSFEFEFNPYDSFATKFNFLRVFLSYSDLPEGADSELEIEPSSQTMVAVTKRESIMTTELVHKLAEDLLRSVNPSMALNYDEVSALFGTRANFVMETMDFDRDGVIGQLDFCYFLECLWKSRTKLKNWMKNRRLLMDIGDIVLTVASYLGYMFILFAYIDHYTPFPWNSFFVSLGSLIISFGFAYNRILQELVDSLHMIFSMKPFQIGDRVMMKDCSAVYTVDNVFILYSYFIHPDGYGTYFRNSMLASANLSNISQENKATLDVKVQLASPHDIDELVEKITEYLASQKLISRKFFISIEKLEGLKHILIVCVTFHFKSRMNFQNPLYLNAKNELMKLLATNTLPTPTQQSASKKLEVNLKDDDEDS